MMKKIYPRTGDTQTVYLNAVVKDPSIEVGDYTIYNDFVSDPLLFERNNVLYHYPINHERLIIGKFCSIACGVKFLLPELVRLDRLFGRLNRCVRHNTFVGSLGYRNGCPGRYAQSQVPVDGFQYLDEVQSPVTVQPFQLPHEEKAVAAVIVVAEVFHLVHTAMAVEIDVAGSLAVFIQWIEKVSTDAPVAGQGYAAGQGLFHLRRCAHAGTGNLPDRPGGAARQCEGTYAVRLGHRQVPHAGRHGTEIHYQLTAI